MRIQHNILAMNAYRNYNKNTSALAKNLEKLSSGYKINRAGDDAAGLAISEKMRAQITGLNAAQKNVKDGISLVKTAEGAMQEIQDMLNRMDYLATQSANGTYDNEVDRYNLQKEVNQLRSEINRIADSANFNGIKLLDGSLDTDRASAKASAISEITVNDYAAAGASDAFETKFITNRPIAATQQSNASFTVNFDDVAFAAPSVATDKNEFSVKIGDMTFTITAAAGEALTGGDIATYVSTAGYGVGTGVTYSGGAAGNAGQTTEAWNKAIAGNNPAQNANNKLAKIDGHFYTMTATGNSITFTQVDYMGTTGEVVNPDFNVSVTPSGNNTNGQFTGSTNWKAQVTSTGVGIGTSHQAQAEVEIDFSKLKAGDKLTVGDKTYVFKFGPDAASITANAGKGEVLVDLTVDTTGAKLFETDSDLADEVKQAKALDAMVKRMGAGATSATWTAGNGGVKDGKATVTFQSLSTYVDKASDIAGTSTDAQMDTEAHVLEQIYATRGESAANVTFNLDVTKIKAGDTFTIDGTTFEFTDGTRTTDPDSIAVNLSSFGISGGIHSSKRDDVMTALKTAINGQLSDKYTVSNDGDTVKLTSKDNASTTTKFENRIAANVELPATAANGKALVLQIGDTSDDFNQLSVSVGDMHTKALKIDEINIGKQDSAKDAIQVIKDAINYVSGIRGNLGATQNRLEHTQNNLNVMAENIQDAESTIRDTDVAEEMMSYTKNNILIQSAQAMLAQANAVPQGVLQLLG